MDNILAFVGSLAEKYGFFVYLVVFFVSFFESFFIIGEFVPGAVFAVGSGYAASKGLLNIYALIVFGSLGAIAADFASFYLAFLFYDEIKDKPFLKRHKQAFEKGVDFFEKFGGVSVFVGRFVGALRPVVPFVAGIFRMNPLHFSFWAILSGILWGIAYFGAGFLFGNNIDMISSLFRRFNLILIVSVSVLVFVYLLIRGEGD
ncbi:DedA family protein [Hippea alviniae]|uniref:DedA family protein n=1 Tax=Hippea alviniae TaxID=1279027 RepID=UPI0003B71490|nr:DedA family protein [Hippea alviniae]